MNFSENERTGALAEMAVEKLFTSWSWSVGKDRIDSGYDLFVEPDRSRFSGLRFLVQVKGTARPTKGAPKAKVKKSNLRKYAANPIPVFLVRSDANENLYWMHVQPWTSANAKRLIGDGETSITLLKDQRLDESEAFHSYLDRVLKSASERIGGLAETADKRSIFLSSLDSRFGVQAGVNNGSETYKVFAEKEGAFLSVEIKPKSNPDNVKGMREAIRYGYPAKFEVESFRMTGSELLKEIGADASFRGSVLIRSASTLAGTVCLYPGNGYSILATELNIPAHLYKGNAGFSISNASMNSPIMFDLRVDALASGKGFARVGLGLRREDIANAPIQELTALGKFGEWAVEVLNKKSLFMQLSFDARKTKLPFQNELTDSMQDVLYYAVILGRLHKIATALNSSFIVKEGSIFTKEDVSQILLVYAILRGERTAVELGPIELVSNELRDHNTSEGHFVITTSFLLTVSDQELGSVPVAIDLSGFTLDAIENSAKYRLTQGSTSSAILYHNEGGETDTIMSAIKKAEP